MRYQSVTNFNDIFVLCHVIEQQNETDLKCFLPIILWVIRTAEEETTQFLIRFSKETIIR